MGHILSVDLSALPDPQTAKDSLVFEDADGDGYNDLRIPVAPGDWKVWRWNPERGELESIAP